MSADLLTPVSAFLAMRENAKHPFLFESVEGGEKLARYSFLGRNPYRVVSAKGRTVQIEENGKTEVVEDTSLFEVLRDLMETFEEVPVPGLPRFTGGAVGFSGYDCVRLLEKLPEAPPDELALPDGVWSFYDRLVAFDHVKQQLVLIATAFCDDRSELEAQFLAAREGLEALERDLTQGVFRTTQPVRLGEVVSNTTPERFAESVRRARAYIREGDIFQVVLSQRFSTTIVGDRFSLYRALRQVNPSPYLFFLDYGAFALVGSSPEVLVRVEEGRAEVLPIAGTRPRGETPEQDLAFEEELIADPKERAEHLMLVDLGRNDLGRVCRFGSVSVTRYSFVERYSHVMHLVSSVTGRLLPDAHALDVLAACFPAGTVSGAPKVRAMEIIDALEPSCRGPYAGAVGYVDFSGNLDTCIAIRTMVVSGDQVHLQAGAGIVADSDPQREFDETVNKARALREALRVAAGELL